MSSAIAPHCPQAFNLSLHLPRILPLMLIDALHPSNIIPYPRYVHSTPSSRSSFMNPPSEARLNLNPSYVEFDMLITTPKKSYMLCR